MIHISKPLRRELLALLAILALASVLRLGWPGTTEFKGDEAHICSLAIDLAEGRSFPLQGTGTSVGLPKAAVSIYLYALPMLLRAGALGATLYTGAWNVLGVSLCWWLARRYFGTRVALIASFLFATAPWAIVHARKVWEPNLLPPLALAYMATGLLALLERRRGALAAHLLLLALTVQVHYSGLVLVPLTALLLILYRKRIAWREALVGAGLALGSAAPFLYYLARGRSGIKGLIGGMLAQPGKFDAQAFRYWWLMVTGSEIHSLAGPQVYGEFLLSIPNLDPLRWALGALAVIGIGVWLVEALRSRGDTSAQAGGIIAAWALAPALVFWRHGTPLFLHYFVIAFPAPFLAAGYAASRALPMGRVAPRWGAMMRSLRLAIVAAIGATQMGVFLILLSFLGREATPGGFGMPLRYPLQAAELARRAGGTIVVVSPGDEPKLGEWVAVYEVLLHGTSHRYVNGSYAALFPQAEAVLLLTPGVAAAEALYREAGALDVAQVVDTRHGEEPFRIARLAPGARQAVALQRIEPAPTLANGIQFVGDGVQGELAPGEAATWRLAWQVAHPGANPRAEYHLFNHLLDAQDGKLWQMDGPTTPAVDWAVGDMVVQVFLVAIAQDAPAGPYRMRVGMYTYPEMANQPVLDVAGNPAGDSVILTP